MSLDEELENLKKIAESEGLTIADYLKREASKLMPTKKVK